MRSAGLSMRTISNRTDLVELFARRQGVNPVTCSWEDLAEFLGDDRFAPCTRRNYQADLRSWFHWLVLMDYRIDDPTLKLHKGKPVRYKPRPVTVEQLGMILGSRMHLRTRAMILLGAYEGFRVHEIAKFRSDDIDGDQVWVTGKGKVRATVPLHPVVAQMAKRMPKGYWFPSYELLGPVQPNSVSVVIGKAMRRAGVNGTAHALRHFFGTQCLKSSGGNLVVTQQLMRHANIASTAGYTLVDDSERRDAVLALPVPFRLRVVA